METPIRLSKPTEKLVWLSHLALMKKFELVLKWAPEDPLWDLQGSCKQGESINQPSESKGGSSPKRLEAVRSWDSGVAPIACCMGQT